MILGLGLDVVSISRVGRILDAPYGERFAHRICTPTERQAADQRRSRAEAYAARWAAKEAFAKAVACVPGLSWQQVEVVRSGGRPTLILSGRAAEAAAARGASRLHLSLTHAGDIASAVVILEA